MSMKPGDLVRVYRIDADVWKCGSLFDFIGRLVTGEPLIFIEHENDNDFYVVTLSKFGIGSVHIDYVRQELQ